MTQTAKSQYGVHMRYTIAQDKKTGLWLVLDAEGKLAGTFKYLYEARMHVVRLEMKG